ncbi:MAG: carboxypeptidase regulatory-like domain-containing protein, partial [Myxococcota bacterium]
MRSLVSGPLVVWIVVALVGLARAPAAWGQVTGRLEVTVLEQERPVSGAEVSLVGDTLLGGAVIKFVGDEGKITFSDLPPGNYELTVNMPGFQTARVTGIRVVSHRVSQQTVQLVPGEMDRPVVDFKQKGVDARNTTRSTVVVTVQPAPRARLKPVRDETCDPEQPQQWWVSPDDSNSMSAPALLKAFSSIHPGWSGVLSQRRWEFFNYAQWNYPPAQPGRIGVVAQVALAGEEDRFVFQVAVTAPRVKPSDRAPMTLTFVMDTSGSMGGRPIELSRQVLRDISSQLRRGDIVSLATWDTEQSVRLGG